ncbi:MAG TPA: NDP-sugar synthase [Solirubrobacteraceae bacterium]|nr:NDP-sugar synthase [Solirubrobacteraceae bacterium]
MQALILAGGEGTRLRPLTCSSPKPVVPLAGRPFISYMLQWLRRHGVDEAILSCGFMADGVREVLGDGAGFGVRLRYVQEPQPLGTGGALKFAEQLLDDRFLMLNGDVLTDIDLTAQLRQHEQTGARATLALIAVEDPSAYGLVRRRDDLSVSGFLEKPNAEEIDTNLVNAGAYVLERSVLDAMAPAGTRISIERDVFPRLVDEGLYGYEGSGYWLDIGTPQRYLQATYDILEGEVSTELGAEVAAAGGVLRVGVGAGAGAGGGVVHAPAVIGRGCEIAPDATIAGRTVLGAGVRLGPGAHVDSSVLLDGARIGAHSRVSRSIVGPDAEIGEHCRVDGESVLGAGVRIGSRNALTAGIRIFPGVELPDAAVAF